jgi:hypothetical protein
MEGSYRFNASSLTKRPKPLPGDDSADADLPGDPDFPDSGGDVAWSELAGDPEFTDTTTSHDGDDRDVVNHRT